MQKNYDDFSIQEAMRLANSPTGQQLLALLKSTDSTALQQAAAQASAGDMEKAKAALQQFMATPQAQQLLKELGRQK